jgi:glyceraldehyde 3-phosphate dehydrogenase
LPWAELSVDIVIESTGRFVTKESAFKHIESGAKKVIISAPGKGDIKTVVIGVNHDSLAKSDIIVSNASCTTNCLAPMIKVLDNAFGVEKGFISTVHAFTADQSLQDAPHRDWRRSRAASMSIIPTSTGAASAVGNVLPHLNGKLDGIALRVPIPDGSLTDLTVVLHQKTTSEELNDQMKKASNNSMKGVLQYSDEPLVSIDFIGNSHSCIFDSKLTTVNGNLAKVIGWYDNEFGYACRTAELAEMLFNL